MPNYMKKAGMDYGHGGSKKKKMSSYGMGGSKKMMKYRKGGSLGITPTSSPGGCGGKRKKY